MEYMRRHGDHVAAAVLDGVFPFDARDPLTYAYDAEKSLEIVFADVPPLPPAQWTIPTCVRISTSCSMGSDPVRGQLEFARQPTLRTRQFGIPSELGYTIRHAPYSSERTASLPLQISRAAATGNLDVFAQAYYDRASALARLIPRGLYLSVMCAEEVPPLSPDEVTRWTAGTYLWCLFRVNEYQRACAQWPRAAIPSAFHEPLRTSIPVLVFSGGRDPATPEGGADEVVRSLTRSRHIVFPKSGHGVSDTPCGVSLIARFLTDLTFEQLDLSCVGNVSTSVPFRRQGR